MVATLEHLKITTAIATLFCAFCGAAQSPSVQIHTSLDPPEIPFHKQAVYTITVDAEGVDVELPALTQEFEGMSYRSGPLQRDVLEGGRLRLQQSFTLDPVQIRDYPLPAPALEWGEGQTASAPPLVLRVRDLTPEELQTVQHFVSATPPQLVSPPPNRTGWYLAAAGIAGALIALAALLLLRRRKEKVTPLLAPWEIARQRLQTLKERKLPESGKFGPYYVDLTAILRYYIEDRFHLHAPEQTTPEFIEAARECGIFSDEQQQMLSGLLRHSDRVKFARYEPSVEEMNRSFVLVERFVHETVPRDLTTADEQEAAA
jgi:LPXTG-motif cell wall-anchored protein